MLEGICRSAVEKWVVLRVAKRLQTFSWVTPTIITTAGLITGLFSAFFLIIGYLNLSIVALLLSGYLDMLDGSFARLTQSNGIKGAVFDIMSDRVVEAGVIVGLYYVEPTYRATLCLWMMVAVLLCVTSFLVVGIANDQKNSDQNKSFYYSPGLIERAEAFVFFSAMILLPHYFTLLAIMFIILVLLTAFVRLFEFTFQAS